MSTKVTRTDATVIGGPTPTTGKEIALRFNNAGTTWIEGKLNEVYRSMAEDLFFWNDDCIAKNLADGSSVLELAELIVDEMNGLDLIQTIADKFEITFDEAIDLHDNIDDFDYSAIRDHLIANIDEVA